MPLLVWRVTERTIIGANEAAATLLGARPEDLEGRRLDDLMLPNDGAAQVINRLSGGDAIRDVEAQIARADGGDAWVTLSASEVEFRGESVWLCVLQDISQRKRALATLEAANAELGALAEFPKLNPGPVIQLDRDGRVRQLNPAAQRVFGNGEVLGRAWRELCPSFDDNASVKAYDRTEPFEQELNVGDETFVFTYAPVVDGSRLFVYGTNVTRRREAERRVAEMAVFPQLNPGPVCRVDRAGAILLFNPAASDVFGDDIVVGASWLEICSGMDEALWAEIVESSSPVLHEAEIGDRTILFTHAVAPSREFVFAYGADLTSQRRAEHTLQQREKMATLGTLAAGMAHELNNPASAAARAAGQLADASGQFQEAHVALSALRFSPEQVAELGRIDAGARVQTMGGVELDPITASRREEDIATWLTTQGVDDDSEVSVALVQMGYGLDDLNDLRLKFDDEQFPLVAVWLARICMVYALLGDIGQGANRVAAIVRALSAYTFLGQAPIQALDVNELLENTLIVMGSRLRPNIDIVREYDSDLPRIQAYGSELSLVWTNLIDNAVDAMQGDGTITLRTRAERDRVVVEVEDTGPGIPMDIQDRIFEAFFTTKEPGEGTGLGLYNVHSIVVEKHFGNIELDAEPGHTRFTIRLPLDFQSEESADVARRSA